MKSINIFFLYLTIIIVLPHISLAQNLEELLRGRTNFREIQELAEDYYQRVRENKIALHPNDLKYKHWKRWEWYIQDRLDKNGNIINSTLANYNALREEKRRYGNTQRSTISFWSFLGPDSSPSSPTSYGYIGTGRVDRIAFHPTDPNIIFIGTPAGGLWKTSDGGTTWDPMDDFLPSMGISGIAISPTNPNLIYILTGCGDGGGVQNSAGVLKSTNGGLTWSSTGVMSYTDYSGYSLEMDPNDDQTLFAATSIGLFKTTNGGVSWNKVISTSWIYDVKFKPGSSDTVFMAGRSTVSYSYYGGDVGEWYSSTFDIPPSVAGRKALAVTPANPDRLYLLTGPHTGPGTFSGMYSSTNGGKNYIRASNSPNILDSEPGTGNNSQSYYDFCVAASPQYESMVVVGGLVTWRSLNFGVGWSNITTYGSGSSLPGYVHPDIHALAFNPLNNYLYAATDGGFYRSTDNGFNWTNLTDGIGTTQFYHMTGHSSNNNYLLGGTQDNGIKFRKNSSSAFDHIAGADGFSVRFYPSDPTKFYCSFNGPITKYWNSGANATDITPRSHWFMELGVHQTNPSIIFAGTNDFGGRLYKSTDEGVSWDTTFIPAGAAVLTCPSNHNRLYIQSGYQLRRSDDLGGSFTILHDKPGFPSSTYLMTDVEVHPYNSGNVYITFGGYDDGDKIFTSIDGGLSWENISGTLPNVPANCIAVNINGDLYLGTDIGVYYKSLGASDWVPYKNGLPATIVTDLYINNNINHIRASTYGRGVWTSPLADGICPNDLIWNLTTALSGFQYFEANNIIENKSVISGGIGTSIFLKAGNHIDLKEGFQAKADGALFNASIGPCASGGIPQLREQESEQKK